MPVLLLRLGLLVARRDRSGAGNTSPLLRLPSTLHLQLVIQPGHDAWLFPECGLAQANGTWKASGLDESFNGPVGHSHDGGDFELAQEMGLCGHKK